MPWTPSATTPTPGPNPSQLRGFTLFVVLTHPQTSLQPEVIFCLCCCWCFDCLGFVFVLWYTMSVPRLLGPPEYWTGSWVLSFPPCMTKAHSDSTLSAASKCHAWKHTAWQNARHLLLFPLVTQAQSSGLMEAGGSDTFGSQSRKGWDCRALNTWGSPEGHQGYYRLWSKPECIWITPGNLLAPRRVGPAPHFSARNLSALPSISALCQQAREFQHLILFCRAFMAELFF